jgi:hypothetical protein
VACCEMQWARLAAPLKRKPLGSISGGYRCNQII